MKRNKIAAIGAGVAAASLAVTTLAAPVGAGGNHGHSHRGGSGAVGLTSDNKLVSFDLKLRSTRTLGAVNGLSGDTRLIGIDYRVQNGKLYGVGDKGGVYTLSSAAKATKVSQLSVALSGTSFGVDFNPAANRLRVISDTGQNLRHNIDDPAAPTTTTVDGALNTPPAAGTTSGVTAAAYTNNDLNASTATTLLVLNTATDQVMLQSPANSGQLAATGALGVDAGSDAGFDIYSDLKSGKTTSNTGFAALTVGGKSGLYSVSLLTGEVSKIRSFPSGKTVTDLAIQLDR